MRQYKKRIMAETFDEHGVLVLTDRGEEVLSKEPVSVPLKIQNRRHSLLDWIRAEHLARMEARMVETPEDAEDFDSDEYVDPIRSPYEVPEFVPTLEPSPVTPVQSPTEAQAAAPSDTQSAPV